jgi:hypothetical protein
MMVPDARRERQAPAQDFVAHPLRQLAKIGEQAKSFAAIKFAERAKELT